MPSRIDPTPPAEAPEPIPDSLDSTAFGKPTGAAPSEPSKNAGQKRHTLFETLNSAPPAAAAAAATTAGGDDVEDGEIIALIDELAVRPPGTHKAERVEQAGSGEKTEDVAEARKERRSRKRLKKKATPVTATTKHGEVDEERGRAAAAVERQEEQEVLEFFMDFEKGEVPELQAAKPVADSATTATEETGGQTLLLPAHVSVLPPTDGTTTQIEIIYAPPDSDNDAIEYLDYDDRKAPAVRYFSDQVENMRTVCKRCGAENSHRTFDCPVLICLTCGARGEHSTRSCPISKTCFNCGMKGHISQTCPSKYSRARRTDSAYDDCGRCGSGTHREAECPTLWRIYEYVTEGERVAILKHREEKSKLRVGEGGEGYIATDEWCHSCGENGHLGDDCPQHDKLPESSAFGAYNTMSGPFFDPDAAPAPRAAKRTRAWEEDGAGHLPDGWGFNAPQNVGQQGRRKERARMQARAQAAVQDEDDPDDWFGSGRNVRNRGMGPARPVQAKGTGTSAGSSKLTFRGEAAKQAASSSENYFDLDRKDPPRAPTIKFEIKGAARRSLTDRLGEEREERWDKPRPRESRDDRDRGRSGEKWDRKHQRDRGRDYDRDHYHRDNDRRRDYGGNRRDKEDGRLTNRPRYTGGYAR